MEKLARSFLFVPGDRPDRFEKALASGAHQIVIDLEDAVAPSLKTKARESVSEWLEGGGEAIVRINAKGTEWFDDDLSVIKLRQTAGLMLPKADISSISEITKAFPGRQIIALIETIKGYMELRQLAAIKGVSRIAFGSVDFGVETGIMDEGEAMTAIRTKIVLESCFAGLPAPVDGVSVAYSDENKISRDVLRSRQLGFGGKLCIHPRQVGIVNTLFMPDTEQVGWARRVLDATIASKGAATTVDGEMVDKPVIEQAQRILYEAGLAEN